MQLNEWIDYNFPCSTKSPLVTLCLMNACHCWKMSANCLFRAVHGKFEQNVAVLIGKISLSSTKHFLRANCASRLTEITCKIINTLHTWQATICKDETFKMQEMGLTDQPLTASTQHSAHGKVWTTNSYSTWQWEARGSRQSVRADCTQPCWESSVIKVHCPWISYTAFSVWREQWCTLTRLFC